jgi:hypothetical protein
VRCKLLILFLAERGGINRTGANALCKLYTTLGQHCRGYHGCRGALHHIAPQKTRTSVETDGGSVCTGRAASKRDAWFRAQPSRRGKSPIV